MSMTINNQSKTSLINYFSNPTFNLPWHCQQFITRIKRQFRKLFFILLYFGEAEKECAPHSPPKTQTFLRSGLTIGIWYLQNNSAHTKIVESLLGSAGVGSCPDISNRCMLVLANQQAGGYSPSTELELISFWPLPFRELVWHISTQVNDGILAAYITLFYPRKGKRRRFIPFLIYDLLYPVIASNFMTLATLSSWSEYVCTHTCSFLSSNTLLGWYRMVETGVLIN